MNKQELIKRIKELPCFEGPIACTVTVNREWLLQSIEQLDEPQKVTVPQFVADFITEQKKLGHTLSYSIDACMSDRVAEWYWDNSELFARAWLDGYEFEQEKRYEVKLKNTDDYLVKTNNDDYRFYNNIYITRRKHTREEIEKSGFGWVFDCPGMVVKEVTE